MKINVTNETARKLLRRLEADQDPEVRDFVAKMEHGLQPGMMLASDELQVALTVLQDQTMASLESLGIRDGRDGLNLIARAIPKLELMLQKTKVREQIEAEQRRRGR